MLARLLTFCLLFAGPVFAQTTAIRAGNVIDPGTGTVSKNQIILIREGKIAEVGPRVEIPKDAEVIDLSGSWVLPGLMDAHTHITLELRPNTALEPVYLDESSALRALRGLHNARSILEAGFTTVRDVGNDANYAAADIRRAIERGWFAGPTVLTSGKIIAAFGGQSHAVSPEQGPFWRFEYIDADTPEEVRKAVRQNIYYGANVIKLVADNSPYHYSEEEIRAAVSEAHSAGIPVSVHVFGGEAARNVILGGADSVEHGFYLSDELLQLMKEKGTVLVGTDFPYEHLAPLGALGGILGDPKILSEHIIGRLRRAHRIGVKMAFGSDTATTLPNKTRGEMMLDYLAVWQQAGVPPAETLKSMTTNVAELLRIQDRRGAIKAGLAADIIATPENPLENIQALRKVHFVMKDGKIVKSRK